MSTLQSREIVRFRRSPTVDGVEIMDVLHTKRLWQFDCHHYAIVVPHDWTSDLRYAGKAHSLEPGSVFCAAPGEVFATKRVINAGTVRVLTIDWTTFADFAAEIAPRASTLSWRSNVAHASPLLRQALGAVIALLGTPEPPLRVQSAVTEVMGVLFDELVENGRIESSAAIGPRALEQIRDHLRDDTAWTELSTLAEAVGLSRFQILRAFRKRFGLSPHAYQMCHRIAKSQLLLKRGLAPAHVAVECGFADQSHLVRSFKRVCGVTPGAYVKQQ